jgi:hypothetical protein
MASSASCLPGILEEGCERDFGHDLEGFLADLKKSLLQVTCFLVGAVVAFFVKFLRHARLEGNGSVKEAINVRQGYFFGLLQ